MKLRRVSAAILAGALLGGCSNFDYYAQSVGGQMRIFGAQRPIEELLADSATPEHLQHKLKTVLRIRDYASQHLGLPDNDSYKYYADVKRPFVLWNVFATEEFSTKLRTWCFPVAGCVGYRGYFSQARAEEFAAELKRQGYDVFVGGVPAYSTLGWFHDPVLNTVLNRSEADLAGLIFHELAHQMVYVRDDSVFNESFATAVEMEGVRRWLGDYGSAQSIAHYERTKARQAQFAALIIDYRDRLKALYESDEPQAELRAHKATLFSELQQDYAKLKSEQWDGYNGYDRWFARELNNAHLASVSAYNQLVAGFQEVLRGEANDLPRFYRAVKNIAKLPKSERNARLNQGITQAHLSATEK